MDNNLIYRDLFKVIGKDFDGKKYEKTSRILMQSFFNDVELWLDIHSYYFPITFSDMIIFGINIISDSNLTNVYNFVDKEFNNFKYLMSGVIFSIQTVKITNIKKKIIHASFGGLLMKLILPYNSTKLFGIGMHILISISKI
ncbi:putative RNA polymerase II subunit (nucleomorph) [Lotharella oceanica]|uniref:DNA-directed RNA polymerases I, II, and III subunit RPABC3 n=1 Tax=Lotharella oceanica TaxID=641309 RepID=A0A060DGS7_9EUKA|nr:putative RNA polymerase II subunit [Lotharella oceanica]|mmetsp:Transcript_29223/g.54715  ORF Transcript_29223/g.54715 Transcript_29223/m.54715 type:complete len:142 (+) Transcript_29223:1-426(+)